MMFRFRFHGRGGQGMKTASRILGTGAFLAGYHAQDTPLYGAERRGAPVTAHTRIGRSPIHERGPIVRPDVVVCADRTLLEEPSARPLAGLLPGGALLLNTDAEAPPEGMPEGCRFLPIDATALALRIIGPPVLSAVLGAAACRISGLVGAEAAARAVEEELAALGLDAPARAKNAEAAREAFARLPALALVPRPRERAAPLAPAPIRYLGGAAGAPTVARPMNMTQRLTGGWRVFRPRIAPRLCSRCNLCFLACPEGCISLDEAGVPFIDYLHCKGCLICEEVCPREGAVRAEREGEERWARRR